MPSVRSIGRNLGLSCVCLIGATATLSAQSVVVRNNELGIKDSDDEFTWRVLNAQAVSGGNGSCAGFSARDLDGATTVSMGGCFGDLTVGGGSEAGNVRVRDTNGVTTTISLDGSLGLAELGSPSDDGDLWIWNHNTDDQRAIDLNGATGTASQQLSGNGFVKAWAKISSNGTVTMCYNCNIDSMETRRLAEGQYEVSFSPLGPDITDRPRLAVLDARDSLGSVLTGQITLSDRTDSDSVWVFTSQSDFGLTDLPFTLFIF